MTKVFDFHVLILMAVVFFVTGCGGGGSSATGPVVPPPPLEPVQRFSPPSVLPDGWIVNESPDLDPTLMSDLAGDVLGGAFFPLDSIAVAHRGELIIDETLRADTDFQDDRIGNLNPAVHAQFSVSKSIVALLVGIAIDQGALPGTDVPYVSLFPYDPLEFENPDSRKSKITLGHALGMTAGFEWNEFDPGFDHPDNQLFSFHREHVDWARGLFDLPLAHQPGKAYAYNTILSTSLGQALENSQGLALEDFAGAYLMAPLQISEVEVLRTPTNLPDLGRGVYVSTRDLAKVGQLVLDGGRWNGNQVVSSEWLDEMLQPRVSMDWPEPGAWSWQLTGYSYQWWHGYIQVDDRQYPTWAARGFGQQLLMIIPELELVVAANSQGYGNSDNEEFLFRLIADYLVPAALAGGSD